MGRLNEGFAWLTCLLSVDVQGRAFHHRGGPGRDAADPGHSVASALLGAYILRFLPGPRHPCSPFLGTLALGLLADAALRIRAARRGGYAPSLFRFLLPSDSLRPERLAWQAHREAERQTLGKTLAPTGRVPQPRFGTSKHIQPSGFRYGWMEARS